MTDRTELPDTISREAHERVLKQRDEAQASLTEATQALGDTKLLFEAQTFFSGKVKDPIAAAEMTLGKIRSVEDAETRQSRLEEAVDLFAPVDAPSDPQPLVEPGEAVPDAPPTPGFMRPNPASDGPSPPEPKLTMQSPEVKALIESGQNAEVYKMIDSGQIEFSPFNRTATS